MDGHQAISLFTLTSIYNGRLYMHYLFWFFFTFTYVFKWLTVNSRSTNYIIIMLIYVHVTRDLVIDCFPHHCSNAINLRNTLPRLAGRDNLRGSVGGGGGG